MSRSRLAIATSEPTRFEVVLYVEGKRVRDLGFTARRTKATLLDYARDNGAEILALMTEEEAEAEWTYDAGTGVVFGLGKAAVAYSGRTERDCAE